MPELAADHFADFVAAVHGGARNPFPWQRDLLDRVLSTGTWPAVIPAPTGLGKTSVLDVATFAAAAGAPVRRVFFVVDRRIVVDEAFDHATRLQARVTRDAAGVLGEVAAGLRRLTGDAPGPAITVTRMRGGTTWDWRWIDRPDRFSIVVGTVDQVGSRLFFRGYGLSERLAPIDAALTGTDSVIFVDEAHLAAPMLTTIAAAQELDHPTHPVARPARVVQVSATPGDVGSDALTFDLDAHLAHPEAARRLTATKTLHTARVSAKTSVDTLAAAAAAATRIRPDALVGVVVNTVAAARAVFDRVRREHPPQHCVLLTGRHRPWDRDRLVRAWSQRITAGWRERPEPNPPTIIVATQCIEVGANLDLDVLLTESAPWDNLVQRIGRVNRLGAVGDPHRCPVVVVHIEPSPGELIYAEPRTATWRWLLDLTRPQRWNSAGAAARAVSTVLTADGVDISPLAVRSLIPPPGTRREPTPAPVLFPQHLDGWVRTAPIPVPDAPLDPFLHGFDTDRRVARVVWRADLPHNPTDAPDTAAWADPVASLPPTAAEELEVPLPALRRWLRHEPPTPVSDDDAPAGAEPEPTTRRATHRTKAPPAARPVLRLTADEPQIIDPDRIRPDDLIVVPAEYGGLDQYGWAPDSRRPVLDIADLARQPPVLRLCPQTLLPLIDAIDADHLASATSLLHQLTEEFPDDEALAELPAAIPPPLQGDRPAHPLTELAHLTTSLLTKATPPDHPTPARLARWTVRAAGPGGEHPATPVFRLVLTAGTGRRGSDTGAASSSAAQTTLLLDEHHAEVGDVARQIAANLRMDPMITECVQQAAEWHDLGKLDRRFQIMLFGGHAHEADAALIAGAARAKSGTDPAQRRERRAAQRASGYPLGGRHEALSARLARHHLGDTRDNLDADLVEHLIAAHHGHHRPLLPSVPDPDPPHHIHVPAWNETITLPPGWTAVDWSAPRRFQQLCRRYGIWGLALLESIVRLADIACSAGETAPGRDQS